LLGRRTERMHQRLQRNGASQHRVARFIDAARRAAAKISDHFVTVFRHRRGNCDILIAIFPREKFHWTVAKSRLSLGTVLLSYLANVRGWNRWDKWASSTGVSKQVYYSVPCRLFNIAQ
jgi:hypothetical protein